MVEAAKKQLIRLTIGQFSVLYKSFEFWSINVSILRVAE